MMRFIIHSKQLLSNAVEFERRIGEKCYIPIRDTIQDHGDNILPNNLLAMKQCEEEVYVFWDGGSLGTMFDMGMAYALGKKIIPVELVEGRNWQQFFKSKIGQEIQCKK